jgi:Flp pilus assembly protein TadD
VHPENLELARLERGFALEQSLARAELRSAEPAARAALELGVWRGETRDFEAAAALLKRAAEALPSDLEAQRAYAVALVHRGEFAAAVGLLERQDLALRLPEELALSRHLATTEAALVAASVPAASLDADLLLELGRLHFDDGRYDAAARAFVQLLRQRRADGLALAYLCEAQVRSKLRITPERLQPRWVVGAR